MDAIREIMSVVVIGAGIVGVATAYELVHAGFEVTLVDSQAEPAQMTSFANGAQLSYDYVAPLANASVWQDLPKLLFKSDSPLRFIPRFDPQQWQFLWNFLCACRTGKARQTTQELLALSYLSRQVFHEHQLADDSTFAYQENGKLVIYSSTASLKAAEAQLNYQKSLGSVQKLVNPAEIVNLEPTLESIANNIAGGIYTATEAVADPYLLSRYLLKRIKSNPELSSKFQTFWNARVDKIIPQENGCILVKLINQQKILADQVVITAGIESGVLTKKLGFHLPIYALKGYSLSMDIPDHIKIPSISVTDAAHKIVYAPLKQEKALRLRMAAMVEMGDKTAMNTKRLALFKQQAAKVLPHLDFSSAIPWVGLRPATAQGKPIIGRSPIKNVWLNTGHGALGLTLALGSARLLTQLMQNQKPDIHAECYSYQKVR